MDTTVWDRATALSAETDRRESRVVLRAALVTGMLLVLIIGANQLGLTRPAIAFTGTTVTAVDAEPGQASIYLDVRNRGILTERLDAVEIDYPGLTVRNARFIPQTLGAFECGPQGYVAVDHLCSVSGHLRSVPEEEGLAGRFDDLRCHRREVVDLADAFNLSEESVDEAEVAAGDAGDRGDGGGLSQVVFVRVLI